MNSEPITDESKKAEKVHWERRLYDPMVKNRWDAAIEVRPHAGGGTRIFPDGTREEYEVAQ